MNMKDVIISIVGEQTIDGAQPDAIELVTDGKYFHRDGKSRVVYDESMLTGLEGTRTTVTVDAAGVVMSRTGNLTSRMVFQEGKKHFFLYETPVGPTTMGVDTQTIRTALDEHGGEMEIRYVIDLDHAVIGHNRFKMNIREQKKDEGRCQI